jgi:hypothetical protein
MNVVNGFHLMGPFPQTPSGIQTLIVVHMGIVLCVSRVVFQGSIGRSRVMLFPGR